MNIINMDDSALSSDSDSDLDLLIKPLIKYDPRPADGANMALELRNAFRRHDKKVLLVDIANKIEWTGGELLERASQIASGLVREVGVKPNDVIMTICNHTDMEILLALGIMFSGAAIYGTTPTDGYAEAKVLCELVRPNVLVVQSELHNRAVALRQNVQGLAQCKIIWLDNPIAAMQPIRRNSINVNSRRSLSGAGQNKSLINDHKHNLLMIARNTRRNSAQLLNLSLDDNNNNNNFCDNNNNVEDGEILDEILDAKLEAEHERLIELKHIIDRDQVILFDHLINGPVDEHLIESIARDAIKPSEHVLTYMLTSGSTGRPKVVPSTHEELVHGLYSMISACVNPVQEQRHSSGVRRGSNCQQCSSTTNNNNISYYSHKFVQNNNNKNNNNSSDFYRDNNNNNNNNENNSFKEANTFTTATSNAISAANANTGPTYTNRLTSYNYNTATTFDSNNSNSTSNGNQHIRYKAPLLPIGSNEIISGDLPLDHGAGLNTMFLSLWLGAKYIVMPSYDVDAFWQAVSDYKITVSISSTTFGYQLFMRLKELIDQNDTSRWQLGSFKFIGCAGSKMAFEELVREVTRVYSHIRVSQCYGCTEIGFISMVHRDECATHLHSTGYLFPGLIAKVVDHEKTTDKPLGPEERGELLVAAKSKFKGYKCHWQDDPARIFAECHDSRGLFYRTGDQAHYDHDARLYIHGRFKDTLLLAEDWKILPAELEEVVQEHPLVEMCSIVGIPDPNLPGCHAPKAFVKLVASDSQELKQLAQVDKLLAARCLANDREFICKNIYDFVAERTARPKHLTGGIRILDEFPRVGLLNKVDRKALKQMD